MSHTKNHIKTIFSCLNNQQVVDICSVEMLGVESRLGYKGDSLQINLLFAY